MTTHPCPDCRQPVSRRAFDCPHCGRRLRRPGRGPFGLLFGLLFLIWNVAMLALLVNTIITTGDMIGATADEYERAGSVLGGGMAAGVILLIWAIGDLILGIPVLLTRPRR